MSRSSAAAAPNGDRVRLLVATDEPLLRSGLLHGLRDHPWVQVVGWGHRPEALRRLVAECGAEVVLAAVGDCAERARVVRALDGVPLLVLGDDDAVEPAGAAVVGRLSRRADVDELAAAVVAVRVGLAVNVGAGSIDAAVDPPEVVDLAEPATNAGILTPRERQIVQLLVDGLSVKQVASRLGIAMQTAKNHIHHVMTKVGVSTRLQLYAWAKDHGFTETAPLAPRREA
jgi:DNA-binding NarL/FixJ family response regulator